MGTSTKKERTYSISCGALPWRMHEGRLQVLLIRQTLRNGTWGIPKGHVQKGETYASCAIREVLEETGITVSLYQRMDDMHISNKHDDKLVMAWLAKQLDDVQPRHDGPQSEVADVAWFDVDTLPPLVFYQRSSIIDSIAFLKGETRR